MSAGEWRQKFSATIYELPRGRLAKTAGVDKETAESWKQGERTANSVHLVNLARGLPLVRFMLADEVGIERDAMSVDGVIRILSKLASRQDAEGAKARMLLFMAKQVDARVEWSNCGAAVLGSALDAAMEQERLHSQPAIEVRK